VKLDVRPWVESASQTRSDEGVSVIGGPCVTAPAWDKYQLLSNVVHFSKQLPDRRLFVAAKALLSSVMGTRFRSRALLQLGNNKSRIFNFAL
jgi:hypothetical protein